MRSLEVVAMTRPQAMKNERPGGGQLPGSHERQKEVEFSPSSGGRMRDRNRSGGGKGIPRS